MKASRAHLCCITSDQRAQYSSAFISVNLSGPPFCTPVPLKVKIRI